MDKNLTHKKFHFGPPEHSRDGGEKSDSQNFEVKIISIISSSSFERDCVWKSLRPTFPLCEFLRYPNGAQWAEDSLSREHAQTILYSVTSSSSLSSEVGEALRSFISRAKGHRVIVIGQGEDIHSWLDAAEFGAEAYIPPSNDLENLIETIRSTSSRNFLMPRDCINALRGLAQAQHRVATECNLDRWFTDRQLDVAKALQRGAANKEIAYKLKLSESTIKVHVRNIMRKVDATNRTQAAFRLSQMSTGSFLPENDRGLLQSKL